ncbi:hypothetical protein [Paraflavitalea speifideaquila]|nr:hypothetical protein [Paraflavitalea speifideiaquila]
MISHRTAAYLIFYGNTNTNERIIGIIGYGARYLYGFLGMGSHQTTD